MSEIIAPAYAEQLTELAGNLVNVERFSGHLAVAEVAAVIPFRQRLQQLNSEIVA